MKDISIRDLTDLVGAEVEQANGHLEKMFDWHFQRDVMIVKWVLGAAASLAIALLIALVKAEILVTWQQAALLASLPLAASSYGLYRLVRLRSIHRQFVAALSIHAQLERIGPFIRRYRGELGR